MWEGGSVLSVGGLKFLFSTDNLGVGEWVGRGEGSEFFWNTPAPAYIAVKPGSQHYL